MYLTSLAHCANKQLPLRRPRGPGRSDDSPMLCGGHSSESRDENRASVPANALVSNVFGVTQSTSADAERVTEFNNFICALGVRAEAEQDASYGRDVAGVAPTPVSCPLGQRTLSVEALDEGILEPSSPR